MTGKEKKRGERDAASTEACSCCRVLKQEKRERRHHVLIRRRRGEEEEASLAVELSVHAGRQMALDVTRRGEEGERLARSKTLFTTVEKKRREKVTVRK